MSHTYFEIIKKLSSLSPRQGEKEIQSAQYLEELIRQFTKSLQVQKFATRIPQITSAYLTADDQNLPCIGCSFQTGSISSKSGVVFNPSSDYISTPNYYSKPTISVSRKYASLINQAQEIQGRVTVEKYSYTSRNFIVGNSTNPNNLIFTHYDSLGGGAIDNAGGVAVCLSLLSEGKDFLDQNLIVFAGNEELSYDFPEYWGYGYRQFEKYYLPTIRQAKQIVIVDGVGLTAPEVITNELDNFLPLRYLNQFQNKVKALSSNQSEVQKCYHCAEDTPDKLTGKHLEQASKLLQKLLI